MGPRGPEQGEWRGPTFQFSVFTLQCCAQVTPIPTERAQPIEAHLNVHHVGGSAKTPSTAAYADELLLV